MAVGNDGSGLGALGEAVVFLRFFEGPPEPRRRAKVVDPLDEVLPLCLLAVLAGAETITDMARFGGKKRAFLRRFRPFTDGTPAHDHLGDILASLDAAAFQRCFVGWVVALTGAPAGAAARTALALDVTAIDGKASRGSGGKAAGAPPPPMVSAFAARQRLVPGRVAVAGKSNEIVAVPKPLGMMAVEGAVVTVDAMGGVGQRFRQAKPDAMANGGCRRDIAQKITGKKADHLLALKANQGTPRADVEPFAAERKAAGFTAATISGDETVGGGHGRIETRTTTMIHDAEGLRRRHAWPGLNGVIAVDSRREGGGTVERETRLSITSPTPPAARLGPIVRSHWAVENSLRWAEPARGPRPAKRDGVAGGGDGHGVPRRGAPRAHR